MTQADTVLIVGAGQGGCQVAASLRQDGFAGRIVLAGDEPGLPYQRPPLSKDYLLGKLPAAKLLLRPESWYADQRIELVHGQVVAIDRASRVARFADGRAVPYDALVLATGARNRALPVEGGSLPGVIGIRTLADVDALAPLLAGARRAVVVGAGFIGLEFAAVAAQRGVTVHVIELADRPMARAVTPAMSAHARQMHEALGVEFLFGEGVARIAAAAGGGLVVHGSGGRELPADLVVVGIGVVPNIELAQEAGLAVDNGVQVDELLRTSDPRIFAIGDAASFPCTHAGGARLRLESVQNAVDQARAIAATLMGRPAPFSALPWFWSDQADMKLQIAGLSQGHDDAVVLAHADPRQKTVLCFSAGRLVAVETANSPGDHMLGRKLLGRAPALTPELARAEGFDLKAFTLATR